MANRGFKYRTYPTDEQKIFFAKSFGCCRKMYNLLLNDKIESYKSTGKFSNPTPAKFKKMEEYSYLNEVDFLAFTNVQLQLNKTFVNHFSKSRKSNTAFPIYARVDCVRRPWFAKCATVVEVRNSVFNC